jgi:hypothetical protein
MSRRLPGFTADIYEDRPGARYLSQKTTWNTLPLVTAQSEFSCGVALAVMLMGAATGNLGLGFGGFWAASRECS